MTVVDCPTCGKKVEWTEQSKYRPFCSERCKQIDLGAWAEEKYAIPAAKPEDDSLDSEGIALDSEGIALDNEKIPFDGRDLD